MKMTPVKEVPGKTGHYCNLQDAATVQLSEDPDTQSSRLKEANLCI